jgi:hypothetical protein
MLYLASILQTSISMFKSKCKILTTYKGFCHSFCTVQNSAVPAVLDGVIGQGPRVIFGRFARSGKNSKPPKAMVSTM